jgi:hypothetical protein
MANFTNIQYFSFLGQLIAKALIDNITINLCLNKIFYKLILNEEITYNDLIFIDKTVRIYLYSYIILYPS